MMSLSRKVFDTESSTMSSRRWLSHRPNDQFPCRTLSLSNTFAVEHILSSPTGGEGHRISWGSKAKSAKNFAWVRKKVQAFGNFNTKAFLFHSLFEREDTLTSAWNQRLLLLVESHLTRLQSRHEHPATRRVAGNVARAVRYLIRTLRSSDTGMATSYFPHTNWSCLGLGGLK